jgi:hypothetical protein
LSVLRSESADGVEDFYLVDGVNQDTVSCLEEVFVDGKLLKDFTLASIRDRINQNL